MKGSRHEVGGCFTSQVVKGRPELPSPAAPRRSWLHSEAPTWKLLMKQRKSYPAPLEAEATSILTLPQLDSQSTLGTNALHSPPFLWELPEPRQGHLSSSCHELQFIPRYSSGAYAPNTVLSPFALATELIPFSAAATPASLVLPWTKLFPQPGIASLPFRSQSQLKHPFLRHSFLAPCLSPPSSPP
ncbi:hypothetical protein P7K49_009554 [Saguinus oedipus]|uniref:Uncharacterized protein n=1 Tax=Saguinus oedipus TaxID=9490 RepID=A0ABQ9VML1_SAGOE|nr:hypothetical protein P7K49_009554 [Saguinus oedipus]